MANDQNQTGTVTVRDDPDNDRYVIEVDGELTGFAEYKIKGDRHLFVHTEIFPQFEGRGLGSQLAAQALADVRSNGRVIVPYCPFIAAYIKRHPEYNEFVDLKVLEKVTESSGGD